MTSVAKTRDLLRGRSLLRGFSLLEMMITLSLVALLISFVFMAYKPDSPSEKMRKASISLEALSARGHTMAILHQKPFWLRFERGQVLLQGADLTAVKTMTPEEEFQFGRDQDESIDEPASPIIDYDSFQFPEGLEVFVRRWGAPAQAWFHQEKMEDPVIFWNFEQSGLCEPISLRLEIDKSWTELEMDPLTGRVADELSEIYD